jgi:hypothetical protein
MIDVDAIMAVPSDVLRLEIYSGKDMAEFGKDHDKHGMMTRDMNG